MTKKGGKEVILLNELIKLQNNKLKYESHEIKGEEIHIRVKSKCKTVKCPYCGMKSKKVHSRYKRTYQEMPVSGKKVYIELTVRKMFCANATCGKKTFSEGYEYVGAKRKKSGKLEREIVNISLNSSSTEASKKLSRSTAKVSASTVIRLLKKMEYRQSTGK